MKRVILAVCLLCVASLAHALSFGEIKTISRLLARYPIPSNGSPRISEVIVSSYVNIAHHEVAMLTWCSEGVASTPIVAGQSEYPYPSDLVTIKRLLLDGVMIPATSISKLDINASNWSVSMSTGTPTKYYSDNGNAVYGFDVYPDTNTCSTITISYIKQPAALSADSDIPFDGQLRLLPFHYTLCLWTAAMMCYSDNRGAEGDRLYAMYIDRIKNMTATLGLSGDYYPSFSGSFGGK